MPQRLLTLHTLSPLHCGTGQGVAGIDLPIQRERHTGWPVIPGSSIKGVLRDAYRCSLGLNPKDADKDKRTIALFGPAPQEELGLGALILGDAFLVAFPVRSLCGVFAWVTCPLAIHRLQRLQLGSPAWTPPLDLTDATVYGPQALVAHGDQVVLEDHALQRVNAIAPEILALLKQRWVPSAVPLLESHLAVVSDTIFTWFARHATQVEARIALDPATKTVNDGQLFYEETVPPEAVFIAPVMAEHARHPEAAPELRQADKALAALGGVVQGKTLQFGGKATIGRGQCALHLPEGN